MFLGSSPMHRKKIGSGLITGNLFVSSVLSPFDGSKYFTLEVQHRNMWKMFPAAHGSPQRNKTDFVSTALFLGQSICGHFCPMSSSPVTAPWYNSELGLHVFSFPEPLMSPCFSLQGTFPFIPDLKTKNFRKNRFTV